MDKERRRGLNNCKSTTNTDHIKLFILNISNIVTIGGGYFEKPLKNRQAMFFGLGILCRFIINLNFEQFFWIIFLDSNFLKANQVSFEMKLQKENQFFSPKLVFLKKTSKSQNLLLFMIKICWIFFFLFWSNILILHIFSS